MGEYRMFVFAVTFIVIFSVLVSTIPADFQGLGEDGDNLTPVDPTLVFGFANTESYCKANFTGAPLTYAYSLNARDWLAFADNTLSTFSLGAKVYVGPLWLGGFQIVQFINPNGTNRGTSLTATEINADDDDGQVKYDLVFEDNGNSAGGFVIYWNTTEHASAVDAWSEGDSTLCLWMMHGTGLQDNSIDAVSLLFQLITFSLPNVPLLINVLVSTPLVVAIAYVIWFFIKESLPFF